MIPKRRSRENHLQLEAASKAYGGFVLELNLAHACCSERRAEGSSGCASQPGYTTLRGRQYALKAASRRGYSTPQLPQQVFFFQLPAKNRVCTAKPFNTKPSAHHTRFFVQVLLGNWRTGHEILNIESALALSKVHF